MILYNFIFIVAAGNMLTVGLKKHVFRLFIWSFRLLKSFLSNVLYTHIYQCSGINTWIPEEVSQSLKKKYVHTVRNCSSKEQFLQGLICSIFGQSWLDFAMVTIIGKVACLNKIWGQQLMDNSKSFPLTPVYIRTCSDWHPCLRSSACLHCESWIAWFVIHVILDK